MSVMISDESTDMQKMDRYVHEDGENMISREDMVTASVIMISEVAGVSDVHSGFRERSARVEVDDESYVEERDAGCIERSCSSVMPVIDVEERMKRERRVEESYTEL